ncbi:MAG TPA: pyridoxal 5'-phosphate synthase glutaminase subunit PdxT [Anaerolineaceae bacterium]|nr:pyridoxal 5'-phosphate synthase glutaminase subunit PdxT [Anaerolineaceae bacterium]
MATNLPFAAGKPKESNPLIIGVLALQGDFREHRAALKKLGIESREVKANQDLVVLDALIIPGGESTTMGKLMVDYGMIEPLQDFAKTHSVWGTCAGAIMLSKNSGRPQPLLGLMDCDTTRNAFGRQVDSFEIEIPVPFLEPAKPDYHLTFIRGPIFNQIRGNAQALLKLPDGKVVAVLDGHLLGTSFHPELTDDLRFHRYFVEMVKRKLAN